jgi:amino acid adenylation domain-containing protein
MLTDRQRAALTARLRRGRDAAVTGITRRDDGRRELPLSFGQEQLWFIDRFAPGQAMYNIPLAISVQGQLDTEALDRAITALASRHEALRTRLVAGSGGQPVQVVDPLRPVSAARVAVAQAELPDFLKAEAVRPFDLAAGPLARFTLISTESGGVSWRGQVLLVVVHHAVFDGWSAGILVRDLAALYREEATGEPAGLTELPVQFADYALWERARLDGEVPAELADYWRGVMDGFETVQFPADRARPVVEDWAGGLATCRFPPALTEGMRDLGRECGTTLFVVLMAGLQALLHRYTGQSDLVVGTVSANRARPELAPMIGFCVNTLPIRVDLSGDPSFAELTSRVKEVTTRAYGHQELPFGRMVDTLKVERDPGRAPVFQIALAFNERDDTPIEAGGVTFALTDLVAGVNSAKFDLSFTAEARAGGLWVECSYKTALFDHGTIGRLLEHLGVLLAGAVADPGTRLSELPVLTAAELRQELTDWNDSAREYAGGCLHERFTDQARRTPDAIAAEYEDEEVSYAELDRRADRVAAFLRDHGTGPSGPASLGPEVLIGVCMRAGIGRLAVLLGILKAGAGYVPLGYSLPRERLSYMIADTGMAVILADEQSAAALPPDTSAEVVVLTSGSGLGSGPGPELAAGSGPGLGAPRVTPDNVAYVIYTSGSTGQPKGVVVEHRQAVNFADSMIEPWEVGPDDVVLQFAAYTFDVSVLDMFVPLLSGAKVVLGHDDTLHTPRRLAGLMRTAGVTFACLPPAVLGLLTGYEFPRLRTLLAAGEELPSELAVQWVRPGLRFVNAYGPTETAVIATYGEVDASTRLPPPIGLPAANYQAYVLDAGLRPVPAGVIGELHLGGIGVARGYLNRPELTTERFIPDPFRPGGRLYKTGDLCRRRADGSIVYVGRTDHQVKIRGLRIELGEIETALGAHPAIAQVVVIVTADRAGSKQLTAYLRPADGQDAPTPPGSAELRAYLTGRLPGYMIPARFLVLDEFPLNSSGKIDRRALPEPGDDDPATSAGEADAPASELEATLAELFASVLHRAQVRPADSFFDLGGNSLQVMTLLDLISGRTGAELSPATVFLHPSSRRLAAHLDEAGAGSSRSLVPLSPGTGGPPLVLIHAIGGTITDYRPLAKEVAGSFAVHGLEAPGLRRAGTTPASLTDLVRDYTTMVRAANPDEPCYLGGWSMGGVVAYEVARRLEADGAKVAVLVLLDAPFEVPADRFGRDSELGAQFAADAAQSLGLDLGDQPAPAETTLAGQLDWLAARLGGESSDGLRRRFEVFRAHSLMLAGYCPAADTEPLRARTLIVSAADSPNADAAARWARALGDQASVARVSSDHYGFLRPPVVNQVAAKLRALA